AIQPAFDSGLSSDNNEVDNSEEKSKVDTTIEEMEGFNVVKAILRQQFDVTRIAARDTQSYFGILLDDNNRKPLCRLHFNAKQSKNILVCLTLTKKKPGIPLALSMK
ncbi:TPA: hypothetical protein ACNUWH_003591, partial [Aeromonas salmonicida subsp. salmonicida]